MSSSTSEPRISLLGLQLGEIITISSSGIIWRKKEHPDHTTMMDPARRLEGASALSINDPENVFYLAKFLGQVLQAAGQPFALRFEDVVTERGYVYVQEDARIRFIALCALSDFWDRDDRDDDENEPEITETPWDPKAYYEAWFKVVPAPQK